MKRERQRKIGKRVLQYLLLAAAMLLLSLLLEVLIFNRTAFLYPYDAVVFDAAHMQDQMSVETTDTLAQLSAEEQKALEVEEENKRILAEYNGEEYTEELDESLVKQDGVYYQKVKETRIQLKLGDTYYVKKLKVSLPLEENAGYTVNVCENGAAGDSIYCSINPKLDAGVANVGERADALEIVLLTGEEPDLSALQIEISNEFSLNPIRIAGLFVSLFFVWLILLAGKGVWETMRKKPQWFFALFALLFGGLLIEGIGTNQVSYDEYAHAKSAYKLSFGSTIETTEAAMQMVGNTLPYFNNPEERSLVEDYEDLMNDPSYIAPDIGHQSRFPRAETRVYYPMAAGFYLGRVLHTSFADMVALAKLGNLLCYIFIVFWAIKKAKGYGMVVAAIGLLPNNIFIASALSYDALVTSCLLFAYVLLLNEFLTPEEKIRSHNALLMLLAFVVGCLSKPVYIVMALLLWFLPGNKFENKWMAVLFKVSVTMVAGLMIYNIFFPTPVAGGDYQLVSNMAYSGDRRSVGTSTTGQISYILANPLTYAGVLIKEMLDMLGGYTIQGVPYVGYAYLGTAPFWVNWLLILTGLFAATLAGTKKRLKGSVKAWTHLMNFGVAAIVFSSMYISYTAVGSNKILGVQGRYFIPLFLPFLSCFFGIGEEKQTKIALVRQKLAALPAVYERVIFGILGAVNLAMTWQLVIMKLNL